AGGAGGPPPPPPPRPRSFATLLVLAVCAALACAGFTALGTWQLQRLQWKLALIERVEQRVHAAPVAAPGPERWPHISAESDEYRHVRLSGTFMDGKSALVQAATELGSGYWLLTPLRVADGDGAIVLVNRGFIPSEAAGGVRQAIHDRPISQEQATTVTGLLRLSEPGGAFLRHNDSVAERWYSRDVEAIAAARGLRRVAPYFIDADAEPARADARLGGIAPVGGLTVVSFHNSHLVYALTWYALALMAAAAGLWIWREERRLRRAG
ncbi:MAG: SURF1 family protein, partial [Bacillota bacterium]